MLDEVRRCFGPVEGDAAGEDLESERDFVGLANDRVSWGMLYVLDILHHRRALLSR